MKDLPASCTHLVYPKRQLHELRLIAGDTKLSVSLYPIADPIQNQQQSVRLTQAHTKDSLDDKSLMHGWATATQVFAFSLCACV